MTETLLMLSSSGQHPSPEEIKETVSQILATGPYRLEEERRLEWSFGWLRELIRALLKILNSFLDGASPAIGWTLIIVLSLVALALVAHIGYTLYRNFSQPEPAEVELQSRRIVQPDELVAEARALAAKGNHVDASRLLFQAALLQLEQRRGGKVRTGLTTTEYLRTFRTPWIVEHLRVFVELINWKWYRDKSFDETDYVHCEAAYGAIESGLSAMDPK